jgi:Domain of unknown function (DUF1707)
LRLGAQSKAGKEPIMTTDTTTRSPAVGIRASDAERERTATRIREAAAEGRLTMAELEERLSSVYSATLRQELEPLVADLPEPSAATAAGAPRRVRPAPRELDRRDRVALAVHAALVAAFAAAVLVRWATTGMVFFWPVFPIFWALVIFAVHVQFRRYGPPWWPTRPSA